MDSENKRNWDNVEITIGGRVIEGITSITYIKSEAELVNDLNKALSVEDYLEAAKLRDQIQSLKK